MAIETLDEADVDGARVAVRVDVNSPLTSDGELADDARFRAHVETLSELLDRNARVAIIAHQGRPGGDDFGSLEPHAERLDDLLDAPVGFVDGTFCVAAREAIENLDPGEAVLLENVRFYSEEYISFDPAVAAETHLVERLSSVLDCYVNDAFAAAHRSQPSLVGFPSRLPAYAGRVMERELETLGAVEETPRPRTYVLGGAKVDDAIHVARSVLDRELADSVLVAGLVGNVFLAADGIDLGEASEAVIDERGYRESIDHACDLLDDHGERIHTPLDVAVERNGERHELAVEELPAASDEPALDVGTRTIERYEAVLSDSRTAILNGPAGVFEQDEFATGSRELFAAVAAVDRSMVGGGDTAAAVRTLGVEGFDHVSTGGGAALRLLTDEELPAVEALRNEE